MKYTAVVGSETVEIELFPESPPRVRARVGDRDYDIELRQVEPGVFWFNVGGRSLEAIVIPNGEGYTVRLGRQQLKLELLDQRALLRKAGETGRDGVAELRAPMPGKVVKLLLEPGAEVEANQGILVIEAMKMQNEMRSPKAGKLIRLDVSEGTTVSAGDLLAAVE